MNRGSMSIAALVVGVTVLASRSHAAAEPPPLAAGKVTTAAASVLLFANLKEAEEACVCGELIRAVRAAAARGVKTREVDTSNNVEAAKVSKQYRVVVAPTILFLDREGKEVSRFQGESQKTLDSVKNALNRMAK